MGQSQPVTVFVLATEATLEESLLTTLGSKRDLAMASYHHYEVSSAAVQIAIVVASASIVAGVAALVWLASALGLVGVAFCVIGFWFPTAVHLF